ncbi:MAG TPA: hypothetical protein DCR21_03440 [Succinivibrionaceae bacterium]|nr:tetratricopeptide repeat protein [Succinivibrio sp.]HAR79864.1 hypothetical protein [Succinivibrionaceae bacterium]
MKLTEQNAKSVIIDASQEKAVFVYFYMEGAECEAATKALTSAISDDNQYVSLVMANVQEPVANAIAMQLGVRGVPAVFVFQKGRPAAALEGDDIVSRLQETLNKFMPSQTELLLRDALAEEAQGNLSEALTKAASAYKLDSSNLQAKLILARLYIKDKNLVKAHELLDNPGREEQNSQEYKDLVSSLSLADQAAESPALKELQKKHADNPDDPEITKSLAAALVDCGKKGEALEMLFSILKSDLSNSDLKKTFIDILNTMAGDPLQGEYRRKLYTLMY